MAESEALLLSMKNINKSFFGVRVLHDVSFDLRAGEVHVLLGENGAGKSTLMKILSAAYALDSGQIFIDGQPKHFTHPAEAQAAGISTIYQHFSQAPHLSVAENICMGTMPLTRSGLVDWKRMNQIATNALANIAVDIDPRTPVRQLSVAARQVVEIATALSRNARILVMDEPTAALTDQEVERLFTLVRNLKTRGVGVIYISHRLEEIWHLGDRVTVLRDGFHVGTCDVKDVDVDGLVRMMIGRTLEQVDLGAPPENSPEVLRVEGLTRRGKFENISFSVRQGEVLGIAGLMGAGRTEVAQAIFGASPADKGDIYVRGQKVRIRHPSAALNLGVGFLTEDRIGTGLGLALSVRDNMTLPMWASGRDYLYGMFLNLRAERQITADYAKNLNVRTRAMTTPVKYLSGGNQQKVVVAKWLIARSTILIMDEPTAGIDIGAKEELHHLIGTFAHKQGGTIIMISSDLPEILKLSDRILVMAQGRLVGELTRAEASEERIMAYALQVNKA